MDVLGFPGGTNGKNPPDNAEDMTLGFHSWLGRSARGEHGNPLQYSCLENPMDRGAWWVIVPWLKRFGKHACGCPSGEETAMTWCFFFSWGWSWSLPPVQCHEPLSIVLQAFSISDLIPWIYLSLPLHSHKGFDLGHTWMVSWFSLLSSI